MAHIDLQPIFTSKALGAAPQAAIALPAVGTQYESPSAAIHRMVNEVRGLPNARQLIQAMADAGSVSRAWTAPSSALAAADALAGAGLPYNPAMVTNLARFGEQLSADSQVNLSRGRSGAGQQVMAYA